MKSTLKANFQRRVGDWINACFGKAIGGDHVERNHRFLEEALELVQACGCTEIEARQLVSYVFSRPVGEKKQEVGGVMTTLAALCNTQDLDMFKCGEEELTRIWTKVEKIREKQASKPKFSPLPVHASSALPYEIAKRIVGTSDNKSLQACFLDPMILQIAEAIEDAERRGRSEPRDPLMIAA